MKRVFKFTIASILLLALVSCSSVSWMSQPYSFYPEYRYLCAKGYGDTMVEAEEDAKWSMAYLLGASVKADRTSYDSGSTTFDSRRGEYEEYTHYYEDNFESHVDPRKLYGLEIVERGKDKNGNVVLAVIDRMATADHYWAELKSTGERLDALRSRLGTGSPIMNLVDAVEYAKVLVDYNNIGVLYAYLSGDNMVYMDMGEAFRAVVDARSKVSVSLDVTGDVNGTIRSAVTKYLTDAGFVVADDAASADGRCMVRIEWMESEGSGVASTFKFEQYTASIVLSDTSNGVEDVFEYHTSGREGHQTYDGAKVRAISVIEKEFSEGFADALKDKFSF